MDKCPKCGKTVYFAERKTSLGKQWHPNCLRCEECGKILAPGQHAERKGLPYCHKPCYAKLFGPQMMGYGSNVVSPANFKRNGDGTLYNGEYDFDLKEVFESGKMIHSNGSPQHNISPKLKRNSHEVREAKAVPNQIMEFDFFSSPPKKTPQKDPSEYTPRERELIKKISEFNAYYEGKKRQSLTIKERTDKLVIEGPLRIYWGVVKPIKLQEFDNVPSVPSPTSWRHSFVPGDRVPESSPTLKRSRSPEPSSPRATSRGVDDSVIFSPPDGVVMRRKNIKKFNTVAYRGDARPDKWKRASINGHIYNFDTRVFTPVLGSCTSVTVDSQCTTYGAIKTLLEKFKIENQPEEYSLYLVSETEGETLLKETDHPLLERIARGPDETSGVKIYLKDRILTVRKNSLVTQPVVEEEEEEVIEQEPVKVEQSLPHEVEQLIAIPEPVLRGILQKFKDDEDREIRTIRARYDLSKRRLKEMLKDKVKTM
ncbi:ras association domain-containing protein 2-like [Saccostrea cucullata]|uniref:ras association domain-containing protein 2-like n=1 Tax=Saccostrea cuccullata TaxID=36930 RepID=UPI002ED1E353